MVKRTTPEFSDAGGWEFLFCHRAAKATDNVFGACPRNE
jgi:hypothetical protein